MSRLLAVAVAVGAAATRLEDLDAHFFAQRLGQQVLESTPVRARSVRASTASLWREGFAHAAADASLAALLAEAADACGRDEACLRRRFADASPSAASLARAVRAVAAGRLGQRVDACRGVTVFSRLADRP